MFAVPNFEFDGHEITAIVLCDLAVNMQRRTRDVCIRFAVRSPVERRPDLFIYYLFLVWGLFIV